MKTTKRVILGIASSVLFATGWIRAAETLDPISLVAADQEIPPISGAPDTIGNACDLGEFEP